MDWLLAPIDASRNHEVSFAFSWHGRVMVLAWGILAPLLVIVARFFKVMPGQDWPRELDNPTWWRLHWMGQSAVLVLTLGAVLLVLTQRMGGSIHGRLGFAVVILAIGQVLMGLVRGSKGGPSLQGDHYDMTPRRVAFEWGHKLLGYGLIALAAATILLGFWHANAPVWMWLTIGIWWSALALLWAILQRRGYARDTYQAIWGPDPKHPGNRRPPIGWGIRRE